MPQLTWLGEAQAKQTARRAWPVAFDDAAAAGTAARAVGRGRQHLGDHRRQRPYIRTLAPDHAGRWVIYGEASRLPEARRRALGVEFRQIPYDVRMR